MASDTRFPSLDGGMAKRGARATDVVRLIVVLVRAERAAAALVARAATWMPSRRA
jgi:hypothetical protein